MYEYKIIQNEINTYDSSSESYLEREINELASEGWEVVNMSYGKYDDRSDCYGWFVLLKRSK